MNVRSCCLAGIADALISELQGAAVETAILCVDDSNLLAPAIAGAGAALNVAGVRLLQPSGDEAWFGAGAGITTVRGAVAETGSLLVASGATSPRSASLIPPTHVALVAASQIVPDLVDALALIDLRAGPAGVVLITGPSKTADIEGVLVTGVHGPGRVVVILVTDA